MGEVGQEEFGGIGIEVKTGREWREIQRPKDGALRPEHEDRQGAMDATIRKSLLLNRNREPSDFYEAGVSDVVYR